MGKKDEKVEAVLNLLSKPFPLTVKQEKFCSNACIKRFLRAKGDNVKKAAKSLRSCLAWRDSINIDQLIADEFPVELSEGVAYIAGHDDDGRPVVIIRMKQDYQKFHLQKKFTCLLVFTLEVAIATMKNDVDQFVLLFDAILFRSASAFMNLFLATLKIVGEFYPGQLHRAFVIDPPSVFTYLWKGVRPFIELSTLTMVISSLDFEESLDFKDISSYPRASSLRFESYDHSSIKSTAKMGSSSRFSFIVHSDSLLKPWSLNITSTPSKIGLSSPSASLLGSAHFSSPAASGNFSFASTPLPPKICNICDPSKASYARTPRPSFLQSPALIFRKECQVSRTEEKSKGLFLPFLKFYRRPYDELTYRSIMRPPLSGLISIVHPHRKSRHMSSVSQRF